MRVGEREEGDNSFTLRTKRSGNHPRERGKQQTEGQREGGGAEKHWPRAHAPRDTQISYFNKTVFR